MSLPFMSAQEAAEFVNNGDNVGFSGFTASGAPKVVAPFIAERAEKAHAAGQPFKINVFTGASTNDWLDGALARAHAIGFRTPYQSTADSRKAINNREIQYADAHLSELAQNLRYGFFGKIDVVIIEAQDVTENGEIVLGTGLGNTPTFARMADKIIVELNSTINPGIRGLHDVYIPLDPPYRKEIPLYKPSDRIGSPILKVDPKKIVAVVHSDNPGHVASFAPSDENTMKIGANVCAFLHRELMEGRLPKEFLPLQSGVGNVANAVLAGLGENKDIPPFMMFTEVVQDSVLKLMEIGKCTFASTCSLSISDDAVHEFFNNIDFFKDKVLIRPGEISNNPGLVRRLGVISMNTAIEADIFGNVNSTHIMGSKMMNGIGGSGDFTRNAYISIFSCPSITKAGAISNIVPMVSHLDHSEHSVNVIITDQGIADLRGKDPIQRAETIIENCAHPMYRESLRDYLKLTKVGHIQHNLSAAFEFHNAFQKTGSMENADWSKFL